jgi:hypothetical protein
MINEKVFANNFSEFWRSNLPNLEAVTRSTNIAYERITAPYQPKTNPHRRDVISESGYRFFLKLLDRNQASREEMLRDAIAEARNYLAKNFAHGGEPIDDLNAEEIDEVDHLVRWLGSYFLRLVGAPSWRDRMAQPKFMGHGLVGACWGDFEVDNILIEMKYVDRGFRSHDLRQVLIYSGLRYFERGATFSRIVLVNPLHGVAFVTSPREVVHSASGVEVLDFFQALSYALASGEVSH